MSRVDQFIAFLRRQSKGWIFVQAFALVVVIGIVDYLTGYEVTFFPFYSFPILLTVFFGNQRQAAALSLCSAFAWWAADTASGHKYSQEWLQIWDTIVRLMFFCLVMFAGTAIRQQRDATRARVALLERLHRLEHDIIHISEQERQRIGRDLHDGVCQYLAAIGFTAGLLKKELQTASPTHAKIAADVADLLNDAIVRARDLSRGLSPVTQDERGLELALEDLAATNTRLTGISCTFQCPDAVPIEDNEVSVHLFRIAQEAMNNAAKHGHAQSIAIRLQETEGKIALTISDDGVGFHPPPVARRGIGLNIMAYRARTIGGDLTIQENSPKGTTVSCTVDKSARGDLLPEIDPL